MVHSVNEVYLPKPSGQPARAPGPSLPLPGPVEAGSSLSPSQHIEPRAHKSSKINNKHNSVDKNILPHPSGK